MRAAVYTKTGPAVEVLKIENLPRPSPRQNEILVRIVGSGINPADVKRRAGWRGTSISHGRIIPHCDGSGEVVEVGKSVTNFMVGDRVWLWNAQGGYDGPGRAEGTAAEFIAIPVDQVTKLHPRLNYFEGACLGVPAITAHYAVFADGPVKGQTILVQGGGGAVAHFAIQFAVWHGARVIATAGSTERAEHALSAGADIVLDRHDEQLAKKIFDITKNIGVDRIIELEFGGNLKKDLEVLKPLGVIAAYSSTEVPSPKFPYYLIAAKGASLHIIQSFGFTKKIRNQAIKTINCMCDTKKLRVAVGKTYPLEQIADAHKDVESRAVIGNVVLEI